MSPADLRRRHAELQRECAVSARETQNTMNASLESHIERIRHRMERIELYNGVMMKRLAQIVDLHRSESSSSSGP
jgi:hypothetical protein